MDTAQWPQGIGVIKSSEKKPRPQKDQSLNCPRCASTNTKFCYYNNYSLSQPRYFCKTCRRYWTDGGSLRSVPVGGGSRKNRRSSSSSSSSNRKTTPESTPQIFSPQNPRIGQGQDLNLAYNPSEFMSPHPPPFDVKNMSVYPSQHFPPQSFSSLMSAESNSVYSPSGFPEFKTSLGFSVDGINQAFANINNQGEADTRVSFPFEELKAAGDQFSTETGGERNNGYWNGMITGGSW